MKRSKHIRIRRIALALAVAAVIPATAQARPMDMNGSDLRAIHQASTPDRGSVEIPYLSHGVGVSASDFGQALAPDDRAFSRQQSAVAVRRADSEIPYLSHGVGVSAGDLGQTLGPDDRSFSRQSESPTTVPSAHGGSSTDLGTTNTVGGLVLILAALGTALMIRHNRKAKLSPA
jgi:hypothetical protein